MSLREKRVYFIVFWAPILSALSAVRSDALASLLGGVCSAARWIVLFTISIFYSLKTFRNYWCCCHMLVSGCIISCFSLPLLKSPLCRVFNSAVMFFSPPDITCWTILSLLSFSAKSSIYGRARWEATLYWFRLRNEVNSQGFYFLRGRIRAARMSTVTLCDSVSLHLLAQPQQSTRF